MTHDATPAHARRATDRGPIPAPIVVVGLILALATAGVAHAAQEPGHGHGGRHAARGEIKALSERDITDLRSGAGMGLALAAERNGYPGPAHVLEHAEALDLRDDQRRKVEASRERMAARARALGGAIVDAEAALDRLFATGMADAAQVERMTAEIGRLLGELRAAHLAAHVETHAVLDPDQIETYARLRGHR